MDKQLLPLLLSSKRFLQTDETEALDRLRMQKGVFLLTMRGPEDWRDSFEFVPYDWGPYSVDLARTVRSQIEDGTLTSIQFDGFKFAEYRTTELGEKFVNSAVDAFDQKVIEFVASVRSFVTRSSFTQLLKDVYTAYPEYATRSKFTG